MFFYITETYLAFATLIFIIFLFFFKKKNNNHITINLFKICKYLTILILIFSLIQILNIFNLTTYEFGFNYVNIPLIKFFKILILCSTIIILLTINTERLEKNNLNYFFPYGNYEFFILILINIIGLFCLLSVETFLLIYLSMELHSLILCILFGLRFNNKYSIEAALKYFIISSFSTILFLLGASFIYSIYGVIDFMSLSILISFDLNNLFVYNNIVIIAFSLIIISILIKLGAAPFHMWSIDVYDGAPTFITLYALVVPKIAYIGFFFKMLLYFPNFDFLFFFLFKFAGICSILIGTIGAMIETKLKRILAYSAIVNFGYMLLCLSTGQIENLIACLFYLVTYIIVTCNIFFIIFSLINLENYMEIKSIFDLKVLYASGNKLIANVLAFLLFTLTSLPPSNIFFSKYLLLYSILENFNINSIFVVGIILFSSILGCFNYIRMIRLIFFNNNNDKVYTILFLSNNYIIYFLISLLSVLNVFILFDSKLLLDFFEYLFIYIY